MKIKIPVVLLIASLFLVSVPSSFAQTSPSDWGAVRRLSTGSVLFVKTAAGKTFTGALANVKDGAIELTVNGRSFTLAKDDVQAIFFAVPKTGKRARIADGITGLLAASFGYGIATKGSNSDNYSALVLVPIAGFVGGALVGNLFGKGKKKGALIYRAK